MRPTLSFVIKINKNKEMTNISMKRYLDEISGWQTFSEEKKKNILDEIKLRKQ